MANQIKLAADIGGTFTDIVLEAATQRWSGKVLTTTHAPELGVIQGIEAVFAQSGLKPRDVDVFIHGTTLATNALIERKGAKTAFVTTEGFRDIVEQGYEKRFDHYDLMIDRALPLVTRKLRLTINERLSADGDVLVPLDETQLPAIAEKLLAEKIEAVAIGLLHAYAHDAHERRVRDYLAKALGPTVTICISSEVAPEIREFERFSTTVANAYVRPLMAGYLNRLRGQLKEMGLKAPLFLMMSGGGLTTLETAARFPIRLVESGPAGGAILAGRIAGECGLAEVLSFDMGGTTAKICLLSNGEPERARKFEIARAYRDMKGSGIPVRIPVIEMMEIGAGGGSIARVDKLSRITVGPDSAGSTPGPVSYGRGGTEPAVTDANLALGKIDPKYFAGGKIKLDEKAATQALQKNVGDPLGLRDFWPAAGVTEIVEENMANAARVHAIERGRDIAACTMIAFGGGAPLHACRLAEKTGIIRIIVPKGAGVGSAIGFLRAPVAYEVTRSAAVSLEAFDAKRVNALLARMTRDALAVVKPALGGAKADVRIIADCRYVGQGHEIRVGVPLRTLTNSDGARLKAEFEKTYEQVYGLRIPNQEAEAITWSVTVSSKLAKAKRQAKPQRRAAPPPKSKRLIYDPVLGKQVMAPVYWRFDMKPGSHITGPAIIAEDETSTIVGARFSASIDSLGYIVMEKGKMSSKALSAIRTQVMWNRLIAVVEEQAQSLLRTAFGTITREAGDLSAGVYDPKGRMIAQAMTGTPGHVNTMATAVAHFFKHFPQSTMKPGDVYVTNDPWLGTGHLFDYVVMTPVFRDKRLVAFFASTCHVIDVGGVGLSAKANSSFEEGTLIPHMKMRKEGRLNEELLSIILANSRQPVEVRGDLLSLISANDTGARRLISMMEEFKLDSIEPLAHHILTQSEKGAREAIATLPDGEWSYDMPLDGYERPIVIKAKLTIRKGKITIDFTGSSPASIYGINSPRTYTHAYSVFGLKAVIAPHVPNNIGSLSCFDLVTELGTCVDPIRPSPVTARHVIGQMLADAVFGCLAQALPGKVQAESAGSIWILGLNSAHGLVPAEETAMAKAFNVINIGLGGIGGRPGKDGLATTAFPSGVGSIPVEITETQCPLYFKRKEFLPDSAGAGEWRGGVSQAIEIANREAAPFTISAATFDRIHNPALGRDGGRPARKAWPAKAPARCFPTRVST